MNPELSYYDVSSILFLQTVILRTLDPRTTTGRFTSE